MKPKYKIGDTIRVFKLPQLLRDYVKNDNPQVRTVNINDIVFTTEPMYDLTWGRGFDDTNIPYGFGCKRVTCRYLDEHEGPWDDVMKRHDEYIKNKERVDPVFIPEVRQFTHEVHLSGLADCLSHMLPILGVLSCDVKMAPNASTWYRVTWYITESFHNKYLWETSKKTPNYNP